MRGKSGGMEAMGRGRKATGLLPPHSVRPCAGERLSMREREGNRFDFRVIRFCLALMLLQRSNRAGQ